MSIGDLRLSHAIILQLLQYKEANMIILHTSMGDIYVELTEEETPNTAANFKKYAESGFYNGTIFHRVINDFMIQCGGFLPGMDEKDSDEPIENEADKAIKNERGTLAMARTGDPHSASSQFFINVKDNPFLNHTDKGNGWGYCVFAKVVEGMDVVDKIKAVETTNKSGHDDVPVEDVIIESVEVK